ncbi:hypothetical protein AGMMS49975_06050 [Clostridia bacterium]|nr:hypothetical protein AGMMS49975_06050 [Clostridia bacterium]
MIREIKTSELRPYENNPRRNDETVEQLKDSIRRFGFRSPLVIDRNNVIICGHARYKAALSIGLSTLPCVIADELTEEQTRAYRIADNAVAEIAVWDKILLNREMAEFESLEPKYEDIDDSENITEDATEQDVKESSIAFTLTFPDAERLREFKKFITALKKEFPDCQNNEERVLRKVASILNE